MKGANIGIVVALVVFVFSVIVALAIGWNFFIAKGSVDVSTANRLGAIIVCCLIANPISVLILIRCHKV